MRELVGKTFGDLTIKASGVIDGTNYLLCECKCGTVFPALASSIVSGDKVDCGCGNRASKEPAYYINRKFGKLTPVEHIEGLRYLCKCDCGGEVETTSTALDNGFRRSCGCTSGKTRAFKNLPESVEYPFRLGNIVVVGDNGDKEINKQLMKCICDCGAVFFSVRHAIASGNVKSCGCGYGNTEALDYGKNTRYGKLTTKRLIHNKREDRYDWLCECDCGNTRVVRRSHLRLKKISMCAECEAKENKLRGGNMRSPIQIKNMAYSTPYYDYQVRVDRKSILGNPFYMRHESERKEVIAKYREYYFDKFNTDTAFRVEVERLLEIYVTAGKLELFCWCAPKECHSEIIKEHIEYLASILEANNA